MKNAIAITLLLISPMVFSFTIPKDDKNFRKSHIDITIKSTGGCTFHIVGDVDYDLCCPPKLNGFTGYVSIWGGKGCPSGNFTFSKISSELFMTFDTDNICEMTAIQWFGSNSTVATALNDANIKTGLLQEIKLLCE